MPRKKAAPAKTKPRRKASFSDDQVVQKPFFRALMAKSQAIAYRFVSLNSGKNWVVEYLSPELSLLAGLDPKKFIGKSVELFWTALRGGSLTEKPSVDESCVWGNQHRGEMGYEIWDSQGKKRYWEESFQFLRRKHGKELRQHGIWFDLTERIRGGASYELRNMPETPRLTSRTFFLDRIHQAMSLAARQNESFAIIGVDMDRLGKINQSFGYETGDLIIREMAQRLSKLLYETDSILPIGGDSFMILIPRVTQKKSIEAIANKILFAFKAPFHVANQDIVMTCSLGIAVYPFDGQTAIELMQHAYQVMRTARQKGGGRYHFYSAQDGKDMLESLIIESQLRHALEKDQFRLHYQPQIDLRSGKIIGAEALIRWEHPELGMVPPLKFISIAEETGLIHSIGEWVLRTACLQRKEWERCGVSKLSMAVNLSAKQFHHINIADLLGRIVRETGINPEELELEITESTLMQYTEETKQTLTRMKAMGMRFSIDDFGTGFSSLVALKQLPVDTLKIDRSFVRDLCTDTDDQAIIQAIISMAHELQLDVVAEGIEDFQQMEFLRSRNCDKGQGYYFAKPLTSDVMLPMLLSSRYAA
ncbi:MAG TPA: bifunctional diguanylate cyclase/phosphodiesterase [Candidatus Omnitrophota bacterium]|nr:bifunctional diguanylate cyclase/phosphodiesterase [Candidatus Omnitrophota bacterium]